MIKRKNLKFAINECVFEIRNLAVWNLIKMSEIYTYKIVRIFVKSLPAVQ